MRTRDRALDRRQPVDDMIELRHRLQQAFGIGMLRRAEQAADRPGLGVTLDEKFVKKYLVTESGR